MFILKRRNEIKLDIQPQPLKVIEILQRAGFEAYIVGGCVRDLLLGMTPNDWDITTNADTEEIKNQFSKHFETGIRHGTITVLQDGMAIEVTTYRIDGEYKDCRRPEQVLFTKSLEEDLARRDFTINAMAYHPQVGLVDLHHGLDDLQSKTIRTVGDPRKRFGEDALRMMRCIRFALCLGYSIEQETEKALKENIGLLEKIAVERIREEMNKILLCDAEFMLLYETGVLKQILPELDGCFTLHQDNPRHIYTVGEHILQVTRLVRKDLALRWAAFLHDIGKLDCKTYDEKGYGRFYEHNEISYERAKEILHRFKFDHKTKQSILTLVRYHDIGIQLTPVAVKKCIRLIGKELFPLLLEHKWADARAASPALFRERFDYLNRLEYLYLNVKDDPMQLGELAIRGTDLIKLGIEGKEIGLMMEQLLDFVIEYPQKNKKHILMEKAEAFRRNNEKT